MVDVNYITEASIRNTSLTRNEIKNMKLISLPLAEEQKTIPVLAYCIDTYIPEWHIRFYIFEDTVYETQVRLIMYVIYILFFIPLTLIF